MKGSHPFGVIDIGNSGLKLGLVSATGELIVESVRSLYWTHPSDRQKPPPKEWLDQPTARRASIDDLGPLNDIFKACRTNDNTLWLVGSVQPRALDSISKMLREDFPDDELRCISYRDVPLELQVDTPEQTGIDRILAACEAWRMCDRRGPVIVIQAGTAITVDWLDENGVFGGGAIMPGLSLTLKYLALGTAQLPWLAPPSDPRPIPIPGRNTREAILAGVNASVIGGIEKLFDAYRRRFSQYRDSIQVVISGGDGEWLSKATDIPHRRVDNLVLRALASLAGRMDI